MAFIAGQDVGLVRLPRATGGQGRLSYDLTPPLPDGLRFDPDGALTISGAACPSPFGPTRFTLSVADGEGRRAGLTFLIAVLPEPAALPSPTAAPTPEPTAAPSPTAAPTPEPTALPSPTAAPTPEPTAAPSPTAAPTPEPTASPSPTAAPTPEPTAAPSPTAAPTPEPTAAPSPTAAPTPVPTAASTRLSDDPSPTSSPPSTATHTPMPTTQLSQSWTPVTCAGYASTGEPTAADRICASNRRDAGVTGALDAASTCTHADPESRRTDAHGCHCVRQHEDQGSDRMGWIVTTILAGVTAATGGILYSCGGTRG